LSRASDRVAERKTKPKRSASGARYLVSGSKRTANAGSVGDVDARWIVRKRVLGAEDAGRSRQWRVVEEATAHRGNVAAESYWVQTCRATLAPYREDTARLRQRRTHFTCDTVRTIDLSSELQRAGADSICFPPAQQPRDADPWRRAWQRPTRRTEIASTARI
jgi:hypothetical protein